MADRILVRLVFCFALMLCVSSLQGCISVLKVNSYFGEGNYAGVVSEVEKEHKTLATTPLHELYFLCASYYEIREYAKFNSCADYILRHPDPATEFYPGAAPTYVNKGEFQALIYSYQARMLLEFGEYQTALEQADKAYAMFLRETSDEYRLLYNRIPPLEVKALANIYLHNLQPVPDLIKEIQSIDTYSPFVRSILSEMRQTALARIYFAQQNYPDARKALEQETTDPFKYLIKPFILLVEDTSLDDNVREGALRIPKFYMLTKSYLETGETTLARQGLDALLANPVTQSMGNIYWLVLKDRAQLAWEAGEKDLAVNLLVQATEVIEGQRATIQAEAYKIGFVGDKQDVYRELIAHLYELNQPAQAFVYAEKAKARALVDLLAGKQQFQASEQTVKADIAELMELEQKMGPETLEAIKTGSQTRGLLLRKRQQLAANAPEVASLVSVSEVHTSALQQSLAADEQLVEFYGDNNGYFAFVLDRTRVQMVQLPAVNLTAAVSKFRRDILNTASDDWRASSEALYRALFAPIAAMIQQPKLLIVPHGPLHYVPFAALFDGQSFLIDSYTIRTLPAASVLEYIRTPDSNNPLPILALGNPDLGDATLDLPGAEHEVDALAGVEANAIVAKRKQATETLVKKYAQSTSVLHIASHGEFDPQAPLQSRLLLAPDSENDGSLTVSELYDLRLNADLVTLSACQTGLGDIQSGDDVIGLTRGFLFAGASNIIASLWVVDDDATSRLMVNFYQNLKQQSTGQALRAAQLKIKQGYRKHPYYWAAFELTGSGV